MHEDPEKITYFAKTNSRGTETPFGIKRKDRARHMYVIGKTGMGKSTLLENMAIQDIRNGEGMGFIDPHGSTAERLLEYVPEHRIKDVLYFAPFDMDHPVAFNVMEDVGYDKRHLVVSGLLSAFRKIWVDAWSARMEYILSNTLLALLEYPGATLLDVNRMLIGKFTKGKDGVDDQNKFRAKVIQNIKDPIVKSFWMDEFYNYSDRYTQEATPAIQNKIGQFTSNPLIRNIVGQPKSSFDIRTMMDQKKILIMNLSKGRVGEVNATLLGSMLVTKIYLAAMSRADVSAGTLATLPNFYFYVDEFQTFANQSFADILSEARKYKLNLIIAHQYVEQMEEEVRNAVFGNVGTTVAFRVGPFDAETLETIFAPKFTKEDLVNLGFAQIYLTLMIDGVGSPPFSAMTLPPFDAPPQSFVPQVVATSQRQFGKHRQDVEGAIAAWQTAENGQPEEEKSRAPRRTAPGVGTPAAAFAPRERPSTPVREHRTVQPPHAHELREVHEPRAPIQAPPLSGASSLREAIEKATGEKVVREEALRPSAHPVSHPRSLKETLQKIIPTAEPKPTEPKPATPKPSAPKPEHSVKRRGMPEQELRDMLRVSEIDGEEE